MEIARLYGGLVRKNLYSHPARAAWLTDKGLRLESFRCLHLGDKRIPLPYRQLNSRALSLVADALEHPASLAWTNIFAPVEILQCFGLTCASMECLSSFLSGFYLEDDLIDHALSEGIAPTLCSYHKTFIGAVDTGLVPLPRIAVTTSMVCDGNIGTFRYMEEKYHVPVFVVDVPHEDSGDARRYVSEQLRELTAMLEDLTGRHLDMDALKEALRSENRAKAHFLSYLDKRRFHAYPVTITLIVFQLFATHLNIGRPWVEEVFAAMDRDVENWPLSDEKRLFWVHLPPYAQPSLKAWLNLGERAAITSGEFDLDYIEPLDPEHPYDSLARKMICNIYNGDFTRKAEGVASLVRRFDPDGVVQFCHWGCKQSFGSVMLLKERMRQLGKPMLILDGDAIDRRNCPDGQIRTRFEAFMELLEKGETEEMS